MVLAQIEVLLENRGAHRFHVPDYWFVFRDWPPGMRVCHTAGSFAELFSSTDEIADRHWTHSTVCRFVVCRTVEAHPTNVLDGVDAPSISDHGSPQTETMAASCTGDSIQSSPRSRLLPVRHWCGGWSCVLLAKIPPMGPLF